MIACAPNVTESLSREQLLEIDYYLRLMRTLEERLVALFRQAKVIGGLYRSLGQTGRAMSSNPWSRERSRSTSSNSTYSPPLEAFYLPNRDKVVAAAREL